MAALQAIQRVTQAQLPGQKANNGALSRVATPTGP